MQHNYCKICCERKAHVSYLPVAPHEISTNAQIGTGGGGELAGSKGDPTQSGWSPTGVKQPKTVVCRRAPTGQTIQAARWRVGHGSSPANTPRDVKERRGDLPLSVKRPLEPASSPLWGLSS